jgi:hypothetical protein
MCKGKVRRTLSFENLPQFTSKSLILASELTR